MKTLKDKKKFGWDKPIKNRKSKKGAGYDKDTRKAWRRKTGEVKDLIIHRLPVNLDEYGVIVNDALSELGYDVVIYWDHFASSYIWYHKGSFGEPREKIENIYDII